MSDKEPQDERDPRHPKHGAAKNRPDPALQRAINDAEYVAELEATVTFLRTRVRNLSLTLAVQDKTQRELAANVELLTAERDQLREQIDGAPDEPEPPQG